jgi:acetolactate synthase-1/2/3 large subunit
VRQVASFDAAAYTAAFLVARGIRRVFGLPGGDNLRLIEALRQAGIDYVLVHHEAAAAFMADADGQLEGRPGVCMSTLGPGAVNLLGGVANSYRERAPVVAITADLDAAERPWRTHQEIDLNALYRPVTKLSLSVTADSIAEILPTLWRLAHTPPWGPVHMALAPSEAARSQDFSPPPTRELAPIPLATPPDLTAAEERIRRARRPFIAAGIGVEQAGVQDELRTLAEAWGAPVAVTPKAKGHFPEDHPLFAATYGTYGDEPLRDALAEADLILAVGLDGVDFVKPWDRHDFPAPVVSIAASGADDPTYQPELAYTGDLAGMLRRLIPLRDGPATGSDRWAGAIRRAVAARVAPPGGASAPGTVAPQLVFQALRHALPDRGIVAVDVGAHKLLILSTWVATRPKTFFVSNGLSAMGYALPAAMALKLARPATPVAAVTGDGGLLMYAGELETLARLGVAVVVVVLVDASLALIRAKQAIARQDPGYGVDFGPVDYAALAAAHGLAHRRIDKPDTAEAVMADALSLQRPVLVEARVDATEYERFH